MALLLSNIDSEDETRSSSPSARSSSAYSPSSQSSGSEDNHTDEESFASFERKLDGQLDLCEERNLLLSTLKEVINENSKLRYNKLLLRRRLARSKLREDRSEALFQTVNEQLRPRMLRLLPEILHDILWLAIPPDYLVNSSLEHGPRSAWCLAQKSKLSFVLVSKAWYHAGLSHLYRDITIRHYNHGPLLLRTLQNNSTASHLMQSLTVRCYIPEAAPERECRDLQRELFRALELIQGLAPNLKKLCISAPLVDGPLIDILQRSTLSITELITTQAYMHPTDAHLGPASRDFLSHISPHLRSLQLFFPRDHNKLTLGPFHFPHLEKLHLSTEDMIFGTDYLARFVNTWKMPRLSHLTYPSYLVARRGTEIYLSFFSENGFNIRTLELDTPFGFLPELSVGFLDSFIVGLKKVLDLCPNLEHLVTDVGGFSNSKSIVLSHPKIRYIDFWEEPALTNSFTDLPLRDRPIWGRGLLLRWTTKSAEELDVDDVEEPYMASDLPSLRAIRIIDKALRNYRQIPFHILPDAVNIPEESFNVSYAGVGLRHEPGVLWQVEDEGMYEQYIALYHPGLPDEEETDEGATSENNMSEDDTKEEDSVQDSDFDDESDF